MLFSSDSDYDDNTTVNNNHDAMLSADSTSISPSITKRRVNFIPKKNTTVNGKSSNPTSPTTPTATTPLSPGTKMRRRRLRTTSRSGDDRISFRGRKPIYTAGMARQNQILFLHLPLKVVLHGTMPQVKSNKHLSLVFVVEVRVEKQLLPRISSKN